MYSKTDNNIGDTWNCKEDGNNYCWNKTEWVNIGTNIDLSNYTTKAELEEKVDNAIKELNEEIQDVADTVITETATTTQNGLMSKEDKAKLDNYVGGVTGDTLPIGSIQGWPSNVIPNNWLLCNGQEVSRTDYAELFNVIGTTYGEGDGSTTFNLPNRQGLIGIGAGTHTDKHGTTKTFELGKEYGEYEHTLTENEMPKHSHSIDRSGWEQTGSNLIDRLTYNQVADDGQSWYMATDEQGGDKAHNNIQTSIATNYIIKAHQSAGVVAEAIDNLSSNSIIDALSANQGRILNETKLGYTYVSGKPQSALDDIPTLLGEDYQDRKPYFIIFYPKPEDNMIFDGCMFMVTGFQNGPNYGEQTAYSYLEKSPKKRYLYDGVWREWKSLSEKSNITIGIDGRPDGSFSTAWVNQTVPLNILLNSNGDAFSFNSRKQ